MISGGDISWVFLDLFGVTSNLFPGVAAPMPRPITENAWGSADVDSSKHDLRILDIFTQKYIAQWSGQSFCLPSGNLT